MPRCAGQLYMLTGVGGQQPRFHRLRQRLVEDVFMQPQTAGGQTALAVLAPVSRLFINVGLQLPVGHILQLHAIGIEVRENVAVCQRFITLIRHLVHAALCLHHPLPHIVGKGHVAADDTALPFIVLHYVPQHLLRSALVALGGQAGLEPLLPALTICAVIDNDVVFVIFDLQTSCHDSSFRDS